MKTFKKIILFSLVLFFSLILSTTFSQAASTSVNNESDLRSAIDNATSGDTIVLEENIVLTRPIEVTGKTLTINGNGHTITRIDTNWSPNGSNGTLITAGSEGTKLTLVNLNLTNSQKYGVQSYNGAYVVLDGVTISDCGFGGVLLNGGTVEIKNLVLNKNGSPSNNGIEIAKGSGITSEDIYPILIMNGTLSSSENENVIYLAENDSLIKFEVKNTESTVYKALLQDNKVVITDSNNNIVFVSNANENVTVTGENYVKNDVVDDTDNTDTNTEVKTPTPEPEKDKSPKTGVESNIEIALFILAASMLAVVVLNKKLK